MVSKNDRFCNQYSELTTAGPVPAREAELRGKATHDTCRSVRLLNFRSLRLLPPAESLGAIAGVDAHVFRSEIAGPITGRRAACVQVHDDMNIFFEQAIAGRPLVEIERLAATKDGDAGQMDKIGRAHV